MKIFKDIIGIVNRTIASFGLGCSISMLIQGRYKVAAWSLLAVSILYMVGYFTERWSK